MGVYSKPNDCPSSSTADADGTFYRACDTDPATVEDFTSHAESKLARKNKRADPKVCQAWGLSGWTSVQAVEDARARARWLKAKFIFSVDLSAQDGKLKQTGDNENHFTFWPYDGVDLLSRATMLLPPVEEGEE